MKVTVISKTSTWHTEELKREAKDMKVKLEISDLKDLNQGIGDLGDIVFWRAASISKTSGRAAALGLIKDSGRVVVNQGVFKFPFITHKLFQQKIAKRIPGVNHIETFTFTNKNSLIDAIEKGVLRVPFIQKPDLGSKGEGVKLIRSVEELAEQEFEGNRYIYQNFVENKGDFRVLVLGGKPLGVMKRIAKKNNFLNNFSQGGSCFVVEDKKTKEDVCRIAVKVAAHFDLAFCGVDIVFDEDKKKYKFLELNTVAQWEGFQSATGINVAREIISFFREMHDRKKLSTRELVRDYYQQNLDKLSFDKAFHYLSRMSLWESSTEFQKKLETHKRRFIGEDDMDILENFKNILSQTEECKQSVINGIVQRKKYAEKYSLLGVYNKILFRALISQTVYKKDVRKLVLEVLNKNDVLEMRTELLKDENALKVLSTHAINFLYFVQEILGKEFSVDVEKLFDIALNKFDDSRDNVTLRIYFLTHCVIGESRFYSRKIDDKEGVYRKIMQLLEGIIAKNYFDVSLDNKMEFLVCGRICGFDSSLEKILIEEAEKSMSEIGNYLVDNLNEKRANISKKDFWKSEHRNVLYLMATSNKFKIQ